MTSVFTAANGRIEMKDTDGTTVFDTDERLFTATDELSGTIDMGAQVARNNNFNDVPQVNINQYHALGRCNEAADTVRGAFFVSTTGSLQGASDIGWFNASGTYVHYWGAIPGIFGSPAKAIITQCCCYTFVAFGGGVYLYQRFRVKSAWSTSPGVTTSVTIVPTTFRYKLLVGTWV